MTSRGALHEVSFMLVASAQATISILWYSMNTVVNPCSGIRVEYCEYPQECVRRVVLAPVRCRASSPSGTIRRATDINLPDGTPPSADEDSTFPTQLGWATSWSGSDAKFDVVLNGSASSFTSQGYHDQDWMSCLAHAFMDDWYIFTPQVGRCDLSAVYAAITGSTRDMNMRYIMRDGTVFQD
ncbi:hypothetical protein BD413DRAFT_614965 [Trametes elegans]|nr:hypothetical protein BD413DRAFT_614965 [Trametes elegans]